MRRVIQFKETKKNFWTISASECIFLFLISEWSDNLQGVQYLSGPYVKILPDKRNQFRWYHLVENSFLSLVTYNLGKDTKNPLVTVKNSKTTYQKDCKNQFFWHFWFSTRNDHLNHLLRVWRIEQVKMIVGNNYQEEFDKDNAVLFFLSLDNSKAQKSEKWSFFFVFSCCFKIINATLSLSNSSW